MMWSNMQGGNHHCDQLGLHPPKFWRWWHCCQDGKANKIRTVTWHDLNRCEMYYQSSGGCSGLVQGSCPGSTGDNATWPNYGVSLLRFLKSFGAYMKTCGKAIQILSRRVCHIFFGTILGQVILFRSNCKPLVLRDDHSPERLAVEKKH